MEQNNYGKITDTMADVRFVQYGDGYSFDFINENKGEIIIKPDGDYIKCHTLGGKFMYIFGKDEFVLNQGLCHYNTDVFILGLELEDRNYAGLRFSGGILEKLFMPNKLEIDCCGDYKITYRDDSIEYELSVNGKLIRIHIESLLREKHGVNGTSLDNTETSLDVIVENGLTKNEILPLYNSILKICQFMSFRANVCFDQVQIISYEKLGNHRYMKDMAEMHVQNRFEKKTDKPWIQCISFEDLGEAIIPLFKSIYEEKDKKPFFSLDFLPKEDEDVNWISPDRIKKICTCLECEARLHKIIAEENKDFIELMGEVKELIKKHEENKNSLPAKTYDVIRNSMQHWDLSASDKIKSLFHMYEEIMIQPGCFQYSSTKFEDAIDAFIKYRNTMTHGNYMRITGEHADTAVNLMNLIYISRLDRIGVSKDMIKEKICSGLVYR